MKTGIILPVAGGLLLFTAVIIAARAVPSESASGIPSIAQDPAKGASSVEMPGVIWAGTVVPQPSQTQVAADVLSFVNGWESSFLSKRGWLHVRERVEQSGMELGTLPDGNPVAMNYVSESWYFLDDTGQVIAAVSQMSDLDRPEVQVSVFENLVWKNLTFGTTNPGEKFSLNLDHGVRTNMASIVKGATSPRVQAQETLASGRQVLEVTTYEDFSPPITPEGVDGPIARVTHRSLFDALSGAPISFEETLRSDSGKERMVSSVSVDVVERSSEPPSDVLARFQEAPK